ncbi:MAG TPA: GYD domain-containing protein [Steroidobacteraceae bacterium]
MAKYLVEVTYTPEGLRGLLKDKASGRKKAVTKLVKSLGGKMDSFYFCFGGRDALIIADMPDATSAVALSVTVSATGLVRTKLTELLTIEETDRALAKKVKYRGPGG